MSTTLWDARTVLISDAILTKLDALGVRKGDGTPKNPLHPSLLDFLPLIDGLLKRPVADIGVAPYVAGMDRLARENIGNPSVEPKPPKRQPTHTEYQVAKEIIERVRNWRSWPVFDWECIGDMLAERRELLGREVDPEERRNHTLALAFVNEQKAVLSDRLSMNQRLLELERETTRVALRKNAELTEKLEKLASPPLHGRSPEKESGGTRQATGTEGEALGDNECDLHDPERMYQIGEHAGSRVDGRAYVAIYGHKCKADPALNRTTWHLATAIRVRQPAKAETSAPRYEQPTCELQWQEHVSKWPVLYQKWRVGVGDGTVKEEWRPLPIVDA